MLMVLVDMLGGLLGSVHAEIDSGLRIVSVHNGVFFICLFSLQIWHEDEQETKSGKSH